MRFGINLIWLCLLAGVCDAIAGREGQSTRASFRKRASFAITGVQQGRDSTGAPPPRLEIRELQKNLPQWNLYLLGLEKFYYDKPQSDIASYFQVAGIHGRPFTTWDNVQFADGQYTGYCTHSSTLFPVWHRPYLALYEQILFDIIRDLAVGFNSDDYTQAAATFRIPFWDWAASPPSGKHVLPSAIAGSAWIQLNLPTGIKTIGNPLFRYHFHPLDPNQLPNPPFSTWNHTLRYPTSQNSDAESQNPLVVDQVDQSQSSYSQRFINLLQAYPLYENFSNKAWFPDSSNTYDSLESLHDQIHGLVGTNGGHMAYLEYSAFDPIFFLHHSNVDRLAAIWQAIYPNSWVEPAQAVEGTATIKTGDTVDTNTPLKPFHINSGGDFWTSTSARYVDTFGYTYPELQGGTVASVKLAVNELYNVSAGKSFNRRSQAKRAAGFSEALGTKIRSVLGRSASAATYEEPVDGNTYTEWITNIRVAQNALESTFHIHIFLGNFTTDPTCWPRDPNLVGSQSVFNSFPGTTKKRDLIITGTVPLTKALRRDADAGKVDLNDELAVVAYLKQNLHWRITNINGSAVARDQVCDLKVSVVSSVVTKAPDICEFPTWGPFKVHKDITDGRPAGLRYSDPS